MFLDRGRRKERMTFLAAGYVRLRGVYLFLRLSGSVAARWEAVCVRVDLPLLASLAISGACGGEVPGSRR